MKIEIRHCNYSRACCILGHLRTWNYKKFQRLADKIEKVGLKESHKYCKRKKD